MSGIEDPFDGEKGRCFLDLIPNAYPYLKDGAFPRLLVLEALGQTVAILQGQYFASLGRKRNERGYLVKVTDFRFEGSARMRDRVILSVRLKRKLGRLVLFYGEAWVGDRRICSGELTFFREAEERQ